MPECEICGKKTDTVYEVLVDGTQMLVCERDAQRRDVVNRFGPSSKRETPGRNVERAAPAQKELVENYGEVIRKAREALGLPMKVLGERISEKESTLTRIEKQETLPSEKTRMKLENELGIKLLAQGAEEKKFVQAKKNEPATLWEFATKREEKDGE